MTSLRKVKMINSYFNFSKLAVEGEDYSGIWTMVEGPVVQNCLLENDNVISIDNYETRNESLL